MMTTRVVGRLTPGGARRWRAARDRCAHLREREGAHGSNMAVPCRSCVEVVTGAERAAGPTGHTSTTHIVHTSETYGVSKP